MRRIFLLCCCLLGLVLPVEAAESSPKYVALTFDDGPSGRFTGRLLDGLKERDAHATFLLCGYRVKQYPNETKRIVAEGHEIGNHGYSHRNMQQLSRREIAQELIDTQALLPDVNICFIRPPGGCCSDGVRQVAEARNLAILNWSVDPRDWELADAASVERAVLKNVSGWGCDSPPMICPTAPLPPPCTSSTSSAPRGTASLLPPNWLPCGDVSPKRERPTTASRPNKRTACRIVERATRSFGIDTGSARSAKDGCHFYVSPLSGVAAVSGFSPFSSTGVLSFSNFQMSKVLYPPW